METKIDKTKSDNIQEQFSISLIKEIIQQYFSENKNNNNEINNDIKIFEKLDYYIQNNLIPKYCYLKLNKFLKFINYIENITNKDYIENKEKLVKNKIIIIISLCFLRINIKRGNHFKIRAYLRFLLTFYINRKITINNLFFIFEIILISIIELLKKNIIKQYQIIVINSEPLLIIKDIIETIINFQYILMKNTTFIESMINLFIKFIEYLEKSKIILKEDELWLKLLENNSTKNFFECYKDKSYQKSIKKIIDFLKIIYKDNIPKKFYAEIYEKSNIDFLYYINSLTIINELIQKEIIKQKNVKIDKGVYLLGNFYKKEHLLFLSNEFSIILTFKLFNNANNVSIFNLIQKGKNIFCISIKNNCLNIDINSDFKWNTNIKISKNIFYFIIITYNKKSKIIKVYLKYNEISAKKVEDKNIEKENVNIPKFGKDMDCIIGDDNLYIILGDIFLINKELDTLIVMQLFNSNGYYSNLIIRNNVNCGLTKNIIYSKNYEDIVNSFCSLKYEYFLIFIPKSLLKENTLNNSLIEFIRTDCYNDFFNSRGIEFLTLMLHNIDSLINDSKILNLFLSKTIEFIANILEYQKNNNNNYIIESNKENLKNKLNLFFMTLFCILNSDKENNNNNKYYRIFSDDIYYNLLIIFSSSFKKAFTYKRIILSILLDNDLFEQKNYITQINNILDMIKVNEINDELLYKLLYIDFFFESKNVKHKKFLNIINSLCLPQYQTK